MFQARLSCGRPADSSPKGFHRACQGARVPSYNAFYFGRPCAHSTVHGQRMSLPGTSARRLAAGSVHQSSIAVNPGQHTGRGHGCAWLGIPRAALGARPLQQLEVAAACRRLARARVPGTALAMCPLQHGEVVAICRHRARVLIPGAALPARPLQHFKMTALRRLGWRRGICWMHHSIWKLQGPWTAASGSALHPRTNRIHRSCKDGGRCAATYLSGASTHWRNANLKPWPMPLEAEAACASGGRWSPCLEWCAPDRHNTLQLPAGSMCASTRHV